MGPGNMGGCGGASGRISIGGVVAYITREEVREAAKAVGMKVREHWVDDWVENTVIAAVFYIVGWYAHYIFG